MDYGKYVILDFSLTICLFDVPLCLRLHSRRHTKLIEFINVCFFLLHKNNPHKNNKKIILME